MTHPSSVKHDAAGSRDSDDEAGGGTHAPSRVRDTAEHDEGQGVFDAVQKEETILASLQDQGTQRNEPSSLNVAATRHSARSQEAQRVAEQIEEAILASLQEEGTQRNEPSSNGAATRRSARLQEEQGMAGAAHLRKYTTECVHARYNLARDSHSDDEVAKSAIRIAITDTRIGSMLTGLPGVADPLAHELLARFSSFWRAIGIRGTASSYV